MAFFKSNSKTLTKLRTYKKDLAPVGFYFDIFSTPIFQVPVMPIPIRIDKLSNGEPTLFITPNIEKLEKLFKKLNLTINFRLFYAKGIENFINYACYKQKEITLRQLDSNKIRKWWIASNSFSACNPDLVAVFTFITVQFLKTFHNIEKNDLDPSQDTEDYKNMLLNYCDVIIKYLRNKIEKNIFFIKREDVIENEKLYLEKKQKNYPLVIKVLVYDSSTNKSNEMGFVPYLIYDDLLDSFCYNKKLLESPDNHDSIDLKVYLHSKIINKELISLNNIIPNSSKIELKDLNLEEIIQKLNILS